MEANEMWKVRGEVVVARVVEGQQHNGYGLVTSVAIVVTARET